MTHCSRKVRWIGRKNLLRTLHRARRLRAVRRLGAEPLERRLLLTTVVSVEPLANSQNARASADVAATFDQDVTAATPQTFVVHASQSRGQLAGAATTVTATGNIATHTPTDPFLPGELIQATVTSGVSTTGGAATPRVWQFRTEATSGSGEFVDSGQVIVSNSNSINLADFDGDGDLDALGSDILLNNGSGVFTDGGQSPGGQFVDVDGDGDLDAAGSSVWLNDGGGVFNDTGQSLGGGTAAFGDLDGDGDMDVIKGVPYGAKRVWLNNGSGTFTDSGQGLGTVTSNGIQIGDLDNDGDLDAFSANFGGPARVWLNNGSAVFSDSGQALGGFTSSRDAVIGDVDGDGDLDAVVANDYGSGGPVVWVNDGTGVFTNSGQALDPAFNSRGVTLGDFDGDGDQDLVVQSLTIVRLWSNDGSGTFGGGDSFTWPGFRRAGRVELGDVDGDGDLDIWAANYTAAGSRLFLNQNLEPNLTLSVDPPVVAEAAGTATVTATLSAVHTQPVTVDLGFGGTATAMTDYTVSATQITIAPGSRTGAVSVTAVQDTIDEPNETVVVEVTSVANAQEVGSQQVTVTIEDDDEPIPVPDVTLSVDNAVIPEAAGVATFSVSLSQTTTVPVTVDLEWGGTATAVADYTTSGTQITIPAGATGGSVTVTAVQDMLDESDETVIVDIALVTGGVEAGVQQQITTITDDDPSSFMVSSLVPTSSGFTAELAAEVDASVLNLYGLSLGEADVMLTGAAVGPVAGSLVVDPSLRSVSFIKTGGPLSPDTYTVTLRSGENGFKDLAGNLLDGDGNGIAGDDLVASFAVAPPAAGAITVGLPDVVRGPGQDVNLPANMTTGIPLSIAISEGTSVRAVDLRVSYDPALLVITGATVGAEMPAGASVVVNTNTPGLAILVFFNTAPLPTGTNTLVSLQAAVPTTDASENYGRGHVLDVHSVVVSDGQDNESPAISDDAMHLNSYFADVSGNGRINASDASQVARFAALLETGFAGSPLTDPLIVGDVSGNGRINAADASLLAQFAAQIPVPEIPPIPVGVVVAGGGGRRSFLLLAPHEAQEGTRNHLEPTSTAIAGRNAVPDYYPAVDVVITDLADKPGGAAGQEEGLAALEEAIDELLSAFDLAPRE